VYFTESFDLTISGKRYPEGQCVVASIAEFAKSYNSWCKYEGLIHFGLKTYEEECLFLNAYLYANTTTETHRIAAELLKYVEVKGLNKHFFQTRSVQELRLEALLLQSEEFYEEGKICIGTVSMADKARFGATEDDCESLASYASAIEGVLCAATIREKKPGRWKLSIRCDADYINGSDVCARIGGGGHAAAAGATLPEGLDEAQARELVYQCIFDQLREQRGNA
jgi:phosphoesterase RecJ-like protein